LFGFGVKQPKGHSEMELHVEPDASGAEQHFVERAP
jgi:hypothetical protein